MITGNIKQYSHSKDYVARCTSCNSDGYGCGKCTWWTSFDKCQNPSEEVYENKSNCGGLCTSARICTPVDTDVCKINSVLTSALNETESKFLEKPPNFIPAMVACKYKLDSFKKPEDYFMWVDTFGQNDESDTLLGKLCGTTVDEKDCMDNVPKCSGYRKTTQFGNECRRLLEKKYADHSADYNTLINEVCLKNNDLDECKCVSRTDPANTIYQKLKTMLPVNDGCWYIPCVNSFCLRQSDVRDPVCPSSFCQSAIQAIDAEDVDIRNNKVLINCNFSEDNIKTDDNGNKKTFKDDKQLKDQEPTPIILPVSDSDESVKSNNHNYKLWIIVGIVILTLFALGMFFFRHNFQT